MENYSHDSENQDGLVIRLGDDGEFILFDGAELDELIPQVTMLASFDYGPEGLYRPRSPSDRQLCRSPLWFDLSWSTAQSICSVMVLAVLPSPRCNLVICGFKFLI